jgi:hypothetical protein
MALDAFPLHQFGVADVLVVQRIGYGSRLHLEPVNRRSRTFGRHLQQHC